MPLTETHILATNVRRRLRDLPIVSLANLQNPNQTLEAIDAMLGVGITIDAVIENEENPRIHDADSLNQPLLQEIHTVFSKYFPSGILEYLQFLRTYYRKPQHALSNEQTRVITSAINLNTRK